MRGAHVDRRQRVLPGVVMIKSTCEPVAIVDGEIKLEFIARAGRWIRPCCVSHWRSGATEVDVALPGRNDTRGAVEKARKLPECNRALAVEAADRTTLTHQVHGRLNFGIRVQERA